MADKPDVLPMWAQDDMSDPLTGQPNVVTPPTEKQNNGWLAGDYPPNSWLNWLARYTYRWIAYFADQDAQGVVNDGTGTSISVDMSSLPSTGALVYIYVVDSGDSSSVYHGMCYLAQSPSGNTSFVDIKQVNITTPEITSAGVITISGGTGPYIAYVQTKTISE